MKATSSFFTLNIKGILKVSNFALEIFKIDKENVTVQRPVWMASIVFVPELPFSTPHYALVVFLMRDSKNSNTSSPECRCFGLGPIT